MNGRPLFKKILIANRGEIAVRVLRTCREMGIATLTLYHPGDRGSLHVRLADETAPLTGPAGLMEPEAVLEIARSYGADAIHPGYGFLSERPEFVRRCEQAGIAFIGPSADTLAVLTDKIAVLERAGAAGYPVPQHSQRVFTEVDLPALQAEAEALGYPLVVKSWRGGRGRGERLVWTPERLGRAVQTAQIESQAVYGEVGVFLEKAVLPAHQISVQVLCDRYGGRVHLGEREGSLIYGNQKIVEESPAPCLDDDQRRELSARALEIAALFEFQGAGTVEYLLGPDKTWLFSEIKPRIGVAHPLPEIISGVDLVREQIRLAAGLPLEHTQGQLSLDGWAMLCRVTAEDPWRGYMPRSGRLEMVRLPGGPGMRVDTYVYCGCEIPAEYDPLVAKVIAWAPDRSACAARLQGALRELNLTGTPTNLPLVQRIIEQPDFIAGSYTTDGILGINEAETPEGEQRFRHLAAMAALAYVRRGRVPPPVTPEHWRSGWHRSSRQLPG